MACVDCGRDVPIENRETGRCATCNKTRRDDIEDELWPVAREMFLAMCVRNEVNCPRCRSPLTMSSDVHHKKGRGKSFADQWAKDNGIHITIDPRFFLGCCRECHSYIETHSAFAKTRGYSLSRLDLIL